MDKTNEKFKYGFNVEAYINKALEKLKEDYHWAQRSQFSKQYRYAIEEEMGQYHFVRYVIFTDSVQRELWDVNPPSPYMPLETAEAFVEMIVADNERNVLYANETEEIFMVPFEQGRTSDGYWYLEKYHFKRLRSGDYLVTVQAGKDKIGASRDFYIPVLFFEAPTFEGFLDKYESLVPPQDFGLTKADLLKTPGLKEFLGY